MHPYSIDTEERKNVYLMLAVISIVFSLGFYKILDNYRIALPQWVESPSVLFFYGILFLIFDKYLWKLLVEIHLIKTPNLNGKWFGFIKTSFDEHSSKIRATLNIFQTWTKIKIVLATKQSLSYSEAASVVIDVPEGVYLNYQYINEPKANAVQTMSIHHGTTRLLFSDKKNTFDGEYYSGRDRQTFGSLFFKRK